MKIAPMEEWFLSMIFSQLAENHGQKLLLHRRKLSRISRPNNEITKIKLGIKINFFFNVWVINIIIKIRLCDFKCLSLSRPFYFNEEKTSFRHFNQTFVVFIFPGEKLGTNNLFFTFPIFSKYIIYYNYSTFQNAFTKSPCNMFLNLFPKDSITDRQLTIGVLTYFGVVLCVEMSNTCWQIFSISAR